MTRASENIDARLVCHAGAASSAVAAAHTPRLQDPGSIIGGTGVPAHIAKMAEENPDGVTVMQWVPTREFPPLAAETVTHFVRFTHKEFLGLLCCTKATSDAELRKRMREYHPVDAFADKYERWFEMVTTRDVATNDRLMAALFHQLHVLEMLQAGDVSGDQARAAVGDVCMNAVLAEARSRGAHVDDPRDAHRVHPPLRRPEPVPEASDDAHTC